MVNTYSNKKKIVSRILFFLTVTFFAGAFHASCSKQLEGDHGPSTVSITIGSVAGEDIITPGAKLGSTVPLRSTVQSLSNKTTIKKGDIEIDLVSTVEPDLAFGKDTAPQMFNKVKLAATPQQIKSSNLNPIAADIPIDEGVKYRILFYNRTTQEFEHSVQGTAGTPLQLDIVMNQTYDWYAYSFDSADDIDPLNLESPQIQTKTNKPLLYAKGVFTATTSGNTPLSITFKHQLKQIRIHLDARGLFGDFTSQTLKFADNDYIKTSAFDVLSGEMTGALTTVPTKSIALTDVEVDSERQKHARYYTADLTRSNYTIEMDLLTVTLPNGVLQDLTTSLPNDGLTTFTFASTGKGKVHHAWLKMWKVIPKKKILHVSNNSNDGDSYAAFNATRASGMFLRNTNNFGPTSNYLRVEEFEHEHIAGTGNSLNTRLADPANYPDIIIAGLFGSLNANDYDKLKTYILRGGVVFLMIENRTTVARNFFRSILDPDNPTSTLDIIERHAGGAAYKLKNIDSDVLAWPFDDVRGKYWGQDRSQTLYLQNVPASQLAKIIIYSDAPVNYTPINTNEISMFRHKTLNLFYAGDTGLLYNPRSGTSVYGDPGGDGSGYPFAINNSAFPIPKERFGTPSSSSAFEPSKARYSWQAHNSALFGNIFAMLVAQSHYMTLDRSPI